MKSYFSGASLRAIKPLHLIDLIELAAVDSWGRLLTGWGLGTTDDVLLFKAEERLRLRTRERAALVIAVAQGEAPPPPRTKAEEIAFALLVALSGAHLPAALDAQERAKSLQWVRSCLRHASEWAVVLQAFLARVSLEDPQGDLYASELAVLGETSSVTAIQWIRSSKCKTRGGNASREGGALKISVADGRAILAKRCPRALETNKEASHG